MKDIFGIFKHVEAAYQQYCYRSVAPLGIKRSEMLCLLSLFYHPCENTAHFIAEHCHLSPSMVSRSLETLRREGYIETHRDPKDSRVSHLHLTKQAAPITERLAKSTAFFISELADGISPEEFCTFKALLERMQQNLMEMPNLTEYASGRQHSGSPALTADG